MLGHSSSRFQRCFCVVQTPLETFPLFSCAPASGPYRSRRARGVWLRSLPADAPFRHTSGPSRCCATPPAAAQARLKSRARPCRVSTSFRHRLGCSRVLTRSRSRMMRSSCVRLFRTRRTTGGFRLHRRSSRGRCGMGRARYVLPVRLPRCEAHGVAQRQGDRPPTAMASRQIHSKVRPVSFKPQNSSGASNDEQRRTRRIPP